MEKPGYDILDVTGAKLTWTEHAETAARLVRMLPAAQSAVRCSDGKTMATRLRAPIYAPSRDDAGSPDRPISWSRSW